MSVMSTHKQPGSPWGAPSPAPTSPLYDRLMARGERDGDCLLWQGACDRGYGRVWIDRRAKRVHRVMYELVVGPVPDGLQLDHLCRRTNCFNVTHLEPVTAQVNISRAVAARPPKTRFRMKKIRRRKTIVVKAKPLPKPPRAAAERAPKTECPQGHTYPPTDQLPAMKKGYRCPECYHAARLREYAARAARQAA